MKTLLWLAAFVLLAVPAWALDCPPPPSGVAPGCRVITLNPAEEMSLLGPNNILDSAVWARRMELEQVITYWREKIKNAPAGEIPKPPETK